MRRLTVASNLVSASIVRSASDSTPSSDMAQSTMRSRSGSEISSISAPVRSRVAGMSERLSIVDAIT